MSSLNEKSIAEVFLYLNWCDDLELGLQKLKVS